MSDKKHGEGMLQDAARAIFRTLYPSIAFNDKIARWAAIIEEELHYSELAKLLLESREWAADEGYIAVPRKELVAWTMRRDALLRKIGRIL